jgi:hypothetical protein
MNTRRHLMSGRGIPALGAALALAVASPVLAQRGPSFGRGGTQDQNTGNSAGADSTSTGDASGGTAASVRPREATISEKPPVVIGYLVAVLVLLTVVGVTIMPSKRTHQD